jgi:lipid A 3-O-deacylase
MTSFHEWIRTWRKVLPLVFGILLVSSDKLLYADPFHLDSFYNKGTLRIEMDNDAIWDKDSNFTNGWSFQYHTVRYATWEETRAPAFIKWVGNHFPTLAADDSIVRYGQGIGQNMITPGDLTHPNPPEGDLPYAGTLTYTLNWQSFNPGGLVFFR